MSRLTLIVCGLVSLALGMLMAAHPAAAEDPPRPMARVLLTQRVELLPQEPLCWNVLQETRPPGDRSPGEGFHAEPLAVVYRVEGLHRIEYLGGPTPTVGPGEGMFIGQDNWHVHVNPGTAQMVDLRFELTCDPRTRGRAITPLGRTGLLPGIRSGPVPYEVQLVEQQGAPGAQTPARIIPGPMVWYVLEGAVAQSTSAGSARYGPGDLFVSPVGTPFQTSFVSATPSRVLIVHLWPAGEQARPIQDVQLPRPTPATLPRTGDEFSWAGPLALLVGTLLLAAGVGLRHKAGVTT